MIRKRRLHFEVDFLEVDERYLFEAFLDQLH